ncbi:hypothetical protein QUF75_17775 [Desulfococcaceae bacterium HSG7]|nr:hypothetical protein [Desulfococcaceae bacterium HSG7]
MNHFAFRIIKSRTLSFIGILLLFALFLSSCVHKVDVQIPSHLPVPKTTSFDKALSDLGQMTLIYGSDLLKIMASGGLDHTGTSQATGGEIPRDIMPMVISALNSIGGNVYYVPFDPNRLDTLVNLGWTTYNGKHVPHVILSGGITQFDRALNTRGKNSNFGVETKPFTNAPKWTPGDVVEVEYGIAEKKSLAEITLDFNLEELQQNIGIQGMQTVNNILVSKGVAEEELAFTLFGPTFGFKGTIKKVEGRHGAVRLLVQLSMMQIVGKYFDLPYWNLLEDSQPDPFVLKTVTKDFLNLNPLQKTLKTQEWLFIKGYDIDITGQFDDKTLVALQHFDNTYKPVESGIDQNTYLKLYCSIPVNQNSLNRRYLYNQLLEQLITSMQQPQPAVHQEIQQAKPEVQKKKKRAKPLPKKETPPVADTKKEQKEPENKAGSLMENETEETPVYDLLEWIEKKEDVITKEAEAKKNEEW